MRKLLAYLKPNFSSHWGNWVLFPLIAFFIGYLPVSVIAAQVGDIYYITNNGKTGWTPDEACSKALTDDVYHSASGGACYAVSSWDGRVFSYTFYGQNTCTAGFIAQPSHICSTDIPPDCPAQGTVTRMVIPTSGQIVDGVFVGADGQTPSDFRNGAFDGCGYVPTYMYESSELTQPDYEYACSDDRECLIIVNMAATGEAASPTSNAPSATPLDDLEKQVNDPGPQPETSETVHHESTSETLPDGSTVQVQSSTTTTVRGAGTDTVETTEQTVFKRSDGIVKTETKTIIEKTNPDGSKTVTEEITYSYTGHGADYAVLDKNSGTLQSNSEPDVTAGGKTSTTKNYDADGNLTSEKSSSESSGEEELKDEEEEAEFCKQNPENVICKEWNGETDSDAKFATDETKSEVDAAWLGLKSTISDVQAEIKDVFSVSDLSGSGLGCYSFIEFMGKSFDACLGGFAPMLGQLGQALLFLTMLLILYMLLKD